MQAHCRALTLDPLPARRGVDNTKYGSEDELITRGVSTPPVPAQENRTPRSGATATYTGRANMGCHT
jgi:hypothetical protein